MTSDTASWSALSTAVIGWPGGASSRARVVARTATAVTLTCRPPAPVDASMAEVVYEVAGAQFRALVSVDEVRGDQVVLAAPHEVHRVERRRFARASGDGVSFEVDGRAVELLDLSSNGARFRPSSDAVDVGDRLQVTLRRSSGVATEVTLEVLGVDHDGAVRGCFHWADDDAGLEDPVGTEERAVLIAALEAWTADPA